MALRGKTKIPPEPTGKSNNTQRHVNASVSPPEAKRDDTAKEEPVSLSTILKEIRDFRQDITGELAKVNSRMNEAEERIAESEERLQSAEEVMAEMLTLHEQLQLKLIDQEGRSRRENVRIYGIPEGAEGEPRQVIPFVEKLLIENLEFADATELQIERAHRAIAPKPPAGAQPRSLLVKFLSFRVKEQVIKRTWQKKGFTWKESKISIDHDYAPGVLAKRREYAEARRVLKENNIRFQTIFPARLRVFHGDGTTVYETVEEATKDLADRGLPVKVITPPASLRERIQRSSWQPARGRRTNRPSGAAGYKERLRVFRRDPDDGN